MDPKDKIAFINGLNQVNTDTKGVAANHEDKIDTHTVDVAQSTPTSTVIFCTECGEKNSIDGRFCQNCGTPLQSHTAVDSLTNANVAQTVETQSMPASADNVDSAGTKIATPTQSATTPCASNGETVLASPQKITITAEKREPSKRYKSEIISTDISKVIQTMAENNAAMIEAVEQAQREAALANGLAEWNIEPPISIVRRLS